MHGILTDIVTLREQQFLFADIAVVPAIHKVKPHALLFFTPILRCNAFERIINIRSACMHSTDRIGAESNACPNFPKMFRLLIYGYRNFPMMQPDR